MRYKDIKFKTSQDAQDLCTFRFKNRRKFLNNEYPKQHVQPPIGSVKKLLEFWQKGGIDAVKIFLNETPVMEGTWVSKIKNLINDGKILSAQAEIELVSFNIDMTNQLYKLDPKKIEENGHEKNS